MDIYSKIIRNGTNIFENYRYNYKKHLTILKIMNKNDLKELLPFCKFMCGKSHCLPKSIGEA